MLYEINDHTDKIISFFYNQRLNMFATTSYDGFICVYIMPNKLISMIKNEYDSYYDLVFLSSNPCPSVIAFTRKEMRLSSYSLSGILIKVIKLNNLEGISFRVTPLFNVYGGTFKDRLVISYKDHCQEFNVPFFDTCKDDSVFDKTE